MKEHPCTVTLDDGIRLRGTIVPNVSAPFNVDRNHIAVRWLNPTTGKRTVTQFHASKVKGDE